MLKVRMTKKEIKDKIRRWEHASHGFDYYNKRAYVEVKNLRITKKKAIADIVIVIAANVFTRYNNVKYNLEILKAAHI